ncbi:MAG: hypothetical protein CMH55_07765 [Myxococcales bacterium]|nr:hypothetical protein [Myxococcales bacterium]
MDAAAFLFGYAAAQACAPPPAPSRPAPRAPEPPRPSIPWPPCKTAEEAIARIEFFHDSMVRSLSRPGIVNPGGKVGNLD